MKLNEKQTHALEEIYRVARMYTKIAAELNKVADTIELESEKNDEEFMKVFGVSQGYYMGAPFMMRVTMTAAKNAFSMMRYQTGIFSPRWRLS